MTNKFNNVKLSNIRLRVAIRKEEKMTYNYSKLRGRIVEKFGTSKNFAEQVGISTTHLSNILNNKNELTRSNIVEWANVLDIPDAEIGEYFFAIEV